jgi:hypothetical protein
MFKNFGDLADQLLLSDAEDENDWSCAFASLAF